MRFPRSALLVLLAVLAPLPRTTSPCVPQCQAADGGKKQAHGYDFFELSRYPVEGKLRPWVELRRVSLEGDGDPMKYHRRVTHWWPRKGVDFTELRDGMIEREWTLAASAMDPECTAGVVGDVQTEELESLSFEPNAGTAFLRRVRGYLTPRESGQYTFKISADDEGYVYLSSDGTPSNARAVCYLPMKGLPSQWTSFATQVSKPRKLEKGRKYYFEVVHVDHRWRDFCDVVWSSRTRPEGPLRGEEFSTIEGKKGTFLVEKWNFRSGDGHPRPLGVPRTFTAHLVGFMGLGNELGEPYDGEEFVAPGVVLRLANGRKRVFHRWLLGKEDRRFAMDLYGKEMKRIKASLDQTEYTAPGASAPPGRQLYTSPHFVFSVEAHPAGEDPKETARRDRFYRSAVAGAEYWYAYLEYGGHLMQYWDRKEKYKHRVHVGGGSGGGYGGCTVGGISALSIALFHEYGHGMYQWWFGHPEIFCDFCQDLGTGGAANKNTNSVRRPYRSALHASYPTALFYSTLGEDPNWGYCAVTSMPKAHVEQNFFQTLARLAEQRGMCRKGIRGAGDIVAEYGARLAEFDFQNNDVLKTSWFAVAKNYLEAMDAERGVYRIVWDEAPEPYGTNIVRLVAEPDAKEITVDFLGYHDPTTYSDWRACIVAVDRHGRSRYSDFWNKGIMTMRRQEGDRRYWLTVTAAPTAILHIPSPLRVCSGRWCPRYPWQVTLKGARPGTPHRLRFDTDDYYASYGSSYVANSIVPAPPDTPARKRFVQEMRKARAAVSAKVETARDPYVRQRLLSIRSRMDTALSAADGAPHPNGGGWVAATAEVAPTAYVGPGAMVLDAARVLDHASVEQYAVVRGRAQLSGSARVGGQAFIEGSARLSGYQRAWYSVGPADPDAQLPELPPRDGEGANAHGLWQNYALDEASVMMLEDRYRDRGVGGFSVPVMNGYVRGKPKLIVAGPRRAFAFDGKTQYLELNARAADMGQITVDMAVRPSGGTNQTLWDFGSDARNCMTLRIDGRGTPVFSATVAGRKIVALPMAAPLARGVWTRLRVEIDGTQIALWANDRLSAKTASTLRPADVFPPGRPKRNFVAASRGGTEHFAGAIDYVVIYHRAHGKAFAELPPPVLDASRRPTQQFATELIKDRAARKRYEIENNRAAGEAGVYYSKLAEDIVIRLHELRNRDPNWPKAIAKAKEDLANIGKTAKPAKAAEGQKEIPPPPQLATLRKQREALQRKIASYAEKEKRYREGEGEWLKTIKDPKYLRLKAEQQAGQEQLDKLRKQVEASFQAMPEEVAANKKIAELTARRAKLGDVVKEVDRAVAEAVAKMPVYWDAAKIEAENRFLRELPVQYEGEHGAGGGGAIQSYRSQQERRRHMAENPRYREAVEIDRELEVLKALSPIHREMHFAEAKEYNALRRGLEGKDSPGRRAGEIVARLREQRRQRILGSEYDVLRRQREALDREIGRLQREYDPKPRRPDAAARRRQELRRQEIRKELFRAYDKAVEPYYLEYHAGVSYLRSAMRGFYNTPYSHHLRSQGLVKKTYRYRDEPGGTMQTAIESYRPENWKTDVRAWDWRTRWERDGTISRYPMTRQWLKRVRGDGPINVVD